MLRLVARKDLDEAFADSGGSNVRNYARDDVACRIA